MATRLNYACMQVTAGGNSNITMSGVTARPTFNQSLGATTGSYPNFVYTIYDNTTGAYEYGTGTYDASNVVISSRNVQESWSGSGNVGNNVISFSSGSTVLVFCGIVHQDVVNSGELVGSRGQITVEEDGDFRINDASIPLSAMIDTTFPPSTHTHSLSDFTEFGDVSARVEGQVLGVDENNLIVPVNPSLSVVAGVSELAAANNSFLVGANNAWTVGNAATTRTALGVSAGAIGWGRSGLAANTYVISDGMPYSGTLTAVRHKLAAGTANLTFQIDGVTVGGLNNLAANSTRATVSSTSNNTFSIGSVITVVVAAANAAADYSSTLTTLR